MKYHAIQCDTSTIQLKYNAVQNNAIQYPTTLQYLTKQYNSNKCNTVQCSNMKCNLELSSAMQYTCNTQNHVGKTNSLVKISVLISNSCIPKCLTPRPYTFLD